MCHDTAEHFIEQCVRDYDLAEANSVLEVGCATGPDFSRLFRDGVYFGVDRKDGPRVDLVCDFETEQLGFTYDVVICAEVLEHTLRPWRLVDNLVRHALPGGIVIITARGYDTEGYAPVHDAPHDYWRLTPVSLAAMMEDAGLVNVSTTEDPSPEWPGAFGVGEEP